MVFADNNNMPTTLPCASVNIDEAQQPRCQLADCACYSGLLFLIGHTATVEFDGASDASCRELEDTDLVGAMHLPVAARPVFPRTFLMPQHKNAQVQATEPRYGPPPCEKCRERSLFCSNRSGE